MSMQPACRSRCSQGRDGDAGDEVVLDEVESERIGGRSTVRPDDP